jgi:hypothetical protein
MIFSQEFLWKPVGLIHPRYTAKTAKSNMKKISPPPDIKIDKDHACSLFYQLKNGVTTTR